LEYNNINGMILSSEMSRKRIKYVKKLVKEGREEVLRVIRVDTQQGYIDLSKKSVLQSDEIEAFKEKYYQSKKVQEIMKILACKVKIELEKLYIQIAWPLYKQYGHAFIAFKEALK
jgi:translation initiation factor 2 subunit 1